LPGPPGHKPGTGWCRADTLARKLTSAGWVRLTEECAPFGFTPEQIATAIRTVDGAQAARIASTDYPGRGPLPECWVRPASINTYYLLIEARNNLRAMPLAEVAYRFKERRDVMDQLDSYKRLGGDDAGVINGILDAVRGSKRWRPR
jgi:hypothetical protein